MNERNCGARPWRLGRRIELGEGHRAARGERRQGGRRAFAADVIPGRRRRARPDARAGEGPVVLAGHAYAGAVIGATRSDKVKALVYVAALAPDEGETVADVFYRGEPHPQAPKLAPDAHGLIYLPEAAFAAAFAQNASKEELAVLAAVQRPISPACITVTVERPLWKDRPAWFLVAEQDRMIVEDNQRFMAERMKARVALASCRSHAAGDRALAVVDIIREAIARSRQRLKPLLYYAAKGQAS